EQAVDAAGVEQEGAGVVVAEAGAPRAEVARERGGFAGLGLDVRIERRERRERRRHADRGGRARAVAAWEAGARDRPLEHPRLEIATVVREREPNEQRPNGRFAAPVAPDRGDP